MQSLALADWLLIIAYLVLTLVIAIAYSKKAGQSLSEFFLGGRNLPWYIAGISMVATTFAADTPLAVTELVGTRGIAGNWLWWNMLIGGMLTTFFFARLWRRAEVLTEVEFIDLRYGGPASRFLRGFKAVYLGLFLNMMVLGWVNLALMSLLEVFFGISFTQQIMLVGGAMLLVAVYSALSGLMGVAVTDMVQFGIAMAGSIVLAILVLNSDQIGGIEGLKTQLAHREGVFDFFPSVGGAGGSGLAKTLTISAGAFLAYIGMQWWASWYPGAEPGGGGYVAQRMMSAKNEKHSVLATLFFYVAHICLRPWPWIIVGLCALVLYAPVDSNLIVEIQGLMDAGLSRADILTSLHAKGLNLPDDATLGQYIDYAKDPKLGYVFAMRDFLPTGLKGLLLVAFLAAYMSTISTQLNWGASYLVNDFYKPFLATEREKSDQKQLVLISRIATLVLMIAALLITTLITSISAVWEFVIECGAGLGLVLILRWYWWRINAWSEITATIAPFIAFGFTKFILPDGHELASFPGSYFVTIGFTTVSWIVVTFLTQPESKEVLEKFYAKVHPGGVWGPVKEGMNYQGKDAGLGQLFVCWVSAIIMTYSLLFASGKLIFQEWNEGLIWSGIALVSGAVLVFVMGKGKMFEEGTSENDED
ncbi:MAG: Na+:solute symporter [Bacteroidia bacterium]|nr:Na+:solute symporter [Bacteroidia bacterium]